MIECFTDPVLRAPTLGCIFMCVAASLMGVVVFLQKKSLLSESLSHAAYPGAAIGVAFIALFLPQCEEWTLLSVLIGALLSSWLGLKAIDFLERRAKIPSDAALCFTLSIFFGLGIVITSFMQASLAVWHKQTQMLLFGQVATMTDLHIWVYAILGIF